MTTELKARILEAINRNTLHRVPPELVIRAGNEIEKIIDEEVGREKEARETTCS